MGKGGRRGSRSASLAHMATFHFGQSVFFRLRFTLRCCREKERRERERERGWGFGPFSCNLGLSRGHGRSTQEEEEKVRFLELKDIATGPFDKPFFFV
ncbi:hypothetical protein SDJN02_20720, partial [Cucurbita argyrosperma subsp. argyrosperma]